MSQDTGFGHSKAQAFFKDPLPKAASVYISTVIVAGLPVFFYSLYRVALSPDSRWLYLVVLAAIASYFPVRIPVARKEGQSLSIGIGEIFVFAAILFFSPEAAAVVAAVEGAVSSARTTIKRLYKKLFNVAALGLVAFLVAGIFGGSDALIAVAAPAGSTNRLFLLLMKAVLAGTCYFLLNSGLVAVGMAVVTQAPCLPLWKRNFLFAWPANVASASGVAAVFASYRLNSFPLVIAVSFLLPVIYYIQGVWFERRAHSRSGG